MSATRQTAEAKEPQAVLSTMGTSFMPSDCPKRASTPAECLVCRRVGSVSLRLTAAHLLKAQTYLRWRPCPRTVRRAPGSGRGGSRGRSGGRRPADTGCGRPVGMHVFVFVIRSSSQSKGCRKTADFPTHLPHLGPVRLLVAHDSAQPHEGRHVHAHCVEEENR